MKSLSRVRIVMLNSFVSILAVLGCKTVNFGGIKHIELIEESLSFEGVEFVKMRNINGSVKIASWNKPELNMYPIR